MLSLEASSTSAELSMVDEELRRATVAHALAKAQVARLPLTLPRSDRSHLASFGQESRAEYRTPRCPPPGIWAAECPDPPARLALHELMLSPGWSEAPASRIVVEPKSWLARLLGV